MGSTLTGLTAATLPLTGDELMYVVDASNSRKTPVASVGMRAGMYSNATLVESHAASAATFDLKTVAAGNPSATDPVMMMFQDGTSTAITGSLGITIPSTATLGTRSTVPFRLWFVLINDAGTARLGVRNCLTTIAGAGQGSTITSLSGFPAFGTLSSTTIAGGSNSAGVTYTSTGVTTQPFVVLGYADFDSGQATAGTWAVSPSRIVMFGPCTPLPGASLQYVRSTDGANATNTTPTMPQDNTIPQISEGIQFMSQAATASAVQNVWRINHSGLYSFSVGDNGFATALFQSVGGNNALAVVSAYSGAAGAIAVQQVITHDILTATVSANTFSIRAGSGAGTMVFNTTTTFGGARNSFLSVEEIMG
jgi:hypothetical protein